MKQKTTILLIALLITGFVISGNLNRQMINARRAYGITQADPLINAPPMVVFTTVAFGGFRGIAADLLWLRSARLQQEGNYFELVQLADWITKLEPRFTEVWAYHAWNLAYNISVLFEDPESRWRWVRHGIGLLRDEGLKYNPGESSLLLELGWFFQHKVGQDIDQAHIHYKKEWAAEMTRLLGSGFPDYQAFTSHFTRTLQENYKLDPVAMQELEHRIGRVDWRLPYTHAMYWACESRKVARGNASMMADRMFYQSMGDAYRNGRLFTGATNETWFLSPDLARLPYVTNNFERMIAAASEPAFIRDPYRFFLREAIFYSFLYEQHAEAEALLARLKELMPEIPVAISVEDFVVELFGRTEGLRSREQAFAMVESAVLRAIRHRTIGENDRANELEMQARLTWNDYMHPRKNRPDLLVRTGLPPIEAIRASAQARVDDGD